MNKPTLSRNLRLAVTGLAAAAVLLSGCRAMRQARAERRANKSAGAVMLDGKFNEWPADASTMADPNWVYFRVTVEGQAKPIQAATPRHRFTFTFIACLRLHE